jgi:prolyl-tRNA synthetase
MVNDSEKVSNELPQMLGARKSELSEWYHNILLLADIVDIRYNIKGMNVWKAYGYQMMQNLKHFWDDMFKNDGIQELYFPQIIPISYCEQNPEWWAGFKEEGFKVIAGENNEIQGALRPTGEAAIYPMYALWIRTYRDLPFRAYETVSSFRYETAHTRPLIRDREITVWHEIHTVHATKEDSLNEALLHVEFYKKMWNHVALKPLIVEKPEWEVFPGAVGGIEFYYISPDGKAMENGSVNILGQAYAKKFNIKYKDKNGQDETAWQVCTGNGARLLSAVLIQHGDDKGLIVPPNIATYQAVIIPIIFEKEKEKTLESALQLKHELQKAGIRVHLDDRDETPGKKYYEWELKGVPVRIEIGPRDITNHQLVLVQRNVGKKIIVKRENIVGEVNGMLHAVQSELLAKSESDVHKLLEYADTVDEVGRVIDSAKTAKIHWCRNGKCYDTLKKIREGAEIFGSDYYEKKPGKCVVCGKDTENLAYYAKTY